MDKEDTRKKVEQLIDYIRDIRLDEAARRDGGNRLMEIIAQATKKAEVRADRKTLETIASILHGTGGKGKVTHERVVSTALSYIRNKLEMYALHESEGEG